MPTERPHYGPSPSRRKKLDELWMRGQDDTRTTAAGVVVEALSGIVAPDGTIAPSVLPLSDTEPPAVTLGGSGTAGTATTASRGDHAHDGPTDPVPAHEALADPHPGYVLESLGIAKGDLLVATGASTFVRLAAPSVAGFHLVTDPTTATGLRWEATPAGGLSGILAGADNVIDGTDEVVVS